MRSPAMRLAPALAALFMLGQATLVHAKRAPGPIENARPGSLRSVPLPTLAADPAQPLRREGPARVQYGSSGLLRRYWLREVARNAATRPATLVARDFVESHAAALGLDAALLDRSLSTPVEKTSLSGTHLRWEQQVDGVPVWRSDLVVKVANGAVSSIQNNLHGGLAVATKPVLDATAAMNAAIERIGPIGRSIGEFSSRLYVVPFAAGPRLAWVVTLPLEQPAGDWRVFVDAANGAVLAAEDAAVYASGTGRVFDPDPMTKMADSSFVDNDDADSSVPFPAAYDIVALNDITLNAGTYSLDGPYARLIDNESPLVAPVTATQPDSFRYQRSASGFEDVMAYYQIDKSQRYVQSLGFSNADNRVQQIDAHGLSGDDNSHYMPSTGNIAFGEGGVDDAEDAGVIWHEYGHSIQFNIVPGWGGGQEGAMGEGNSDYWGGSYSLSISPTFQPNLLARWDGAGLTGISRLLIDTSLHYPENAGGEVHAAGTLWCSGLMDCWWRLGRPVMDRLVLDHLYAMGTSATMADAAQQIIQSDIDLFAGAHVETLVDRFAFWGFVNAGDFIPVIAHTPLTDTENTSGPFVVTATITPPLPIHATVFWGVGAITDSIAMTPTANPNEYSASIPGPLNNVDVHYYIRARFDAGGMATDPAGAPASFHAFHVGPDLVAPVIVHVPLPNSAATLWPLTVFAAATDSFAGVNPDSVRVDWTKNASAGQTFYLTRVGATNNWSGDFPGVTADVAPGDVIAYHITARDLAITPNVTRDPGAGEHSFTIMPLRGNVLVLDDDEVASGNAFAGILNALGYITTVEPPAASNPATWPGYSFIVSSSGRNFYTDIIDSRYRSALQDYVAAGHKLLIEGGQVGSSALRPPGYPMFAANVLHGTAWYSDNPSNLQRIPAQASHPIATTPNALPATLPLNYTDWGSGDSYQVVAPAFVVYGATYMPGNAGILVYDPTPPPQSGQIVVFPFNLKELGDASLRSQLVENVAAYLTASEPAGDGTVSGTVRLGLASDYSGVTVTASPGGASASTNSAGVFSLVGIYPGTSTLTFRKTGYRPETRTVNLVAGETQTGMVVLLYPMPTAQACVSPALAIGDYPSSGVTSSQNVAAAFAVSTVTVDLDLTHPSVGDLIVELRHGAKTVTLRNRDGGTSDNIVGNFPRTLAVTGPGSLSSTFAGDPSNGTWTLFVSDNASSNAGTINSWCLNIEGPADTTITVGVSGAGAPTAATLLPAMPNPVNAGGTSLRFALPHRAPMTLAVYDVSGRLVKTLVNGVREAGEQAILWDGRGGDGRPAAAGIYLVRFRTTGHETTRRISLLR